MAPSEDETVARSADGESVSLDALADFLRDGRLLHQAGADAQRVQTALYRLVAEGAPVDPDRLADAVGLGRDEVAEIIEVIPPSNFQRDEANRIVGFRGLGQVPSRHRLTLADPLLAGHKLYAWCAFDCLFLPALLDGAMEVASTCPVTRAEIRLTITPMGVAQVQPESVVMSFVTPETASLHADLHGTFCRHVNFFASATAAETWRADNRGATIITLDQGFELGRVRNQVSFGAGPADHG